MQAFVLLVGLMLSAAALAQDHVFAAATLLAWSVVLSVVIRRARTWSDE